MSRLKNISYVRLSLEIYFFKGSYISYVRLSLATWYLKFVVLKFLIES